MRTQQTTPSPVLITFGVLIGWIMLGAPLGATAKAPNSGSKQVEFSLDAKDQHLSDVLKGISEDTGYTIKMDEGWSDAPVTVKLEKVSLENGLKSLITTLGIRSYALIINDSEKRIVALTCGCPSHFSNKNYPISSGLQNRDQRLTAAAGVVPKHHHTPFQDFFDINLAGIHPARK